ncbi:MAG: hypothetical protein QMD78_06940 [Methanocellales archaeon]|nr:hypothetical protein [Methanocellales archaeon]
MQGVEGDQKLKEWYKQLYEEERSRDSIILQQFSLGMIVIGVLISTMVMVQSSSIQCKTPYKAVISIIGIVFLSILTLYIHHASDDKMWARRQRIKIEDNWKKEIEKKLNSSIEFRPERSLGRLRYCG